MKKITFNILCVQFLLIFFSFNSAIAQVQDGMIDDPGDIAFVAFHDNADAFSFVFLDDCPANTQLSFVDRAYDVATAGFICCGESELIWTNNTMNVIPRGTVINIFDDLNDNTWKTNMGSLLENNNAQVGSSNFGNFTTGNSDQVYALTGTRENPGVYLAFVGASAPLPPALMDGVNAVITTGQGFYNGSTSCNSTAGDCAAMINNIANWAIGSFAYPSSVDTSFNGSAIISNDAPTAAAPSAPTVIEDDTNIAIADDIQVADTENDDQTVTFTITGGTVTLGTTGITFGGGGNGSASFTAAGTITAVNTALDAATFTPTANLNGTNAGSISFTTNDGIDTSAPAAVTFDITAVNDAPSFTLPAMANQTVDEDAAAQTVAGFATAIEDGDAETTQMLTFNVSAANTALFSAGPAIDPATGNLTYTPAADAFGTTTITVSLSDDGGQTNGGVDESSDQTFDITITAVNDTTPVITSITDDTGISNTDFITNDNTPTVNGTAEPNSIITLIVNGTSSALFGLTVTTDMMGDFTFPFPAAFGSLPDGMGSFSVTSSLNGVTLSSAVLNATIDTAVPVVQSITLLGTPALTATTVDYTVTFDGNANDITADDFELTTTGSAVGNIASVSAVSGTSVTVTIDGITASLVGTIRLDLKASTDITDDAGNGNGTNGNVAAFTTGDVHNADFSTLGIAESELADSISIINPVLGNTIEIIGANANKVESVHIYNVSGQSVSHSTNVSGLVAGIYFVKMTIEEKSLVKQIAKK